MIMIRATAAVLLLACVLPATLAINNGVGLRPPLGFGAGSKCGRDVCNADEVLQMAEAIVSSGLKDIGFEYINLDDCWGYLRDKDGHYRADPTRFPDGPNGEPGMKVVADKLHAMGLKYGLYTDGGTQTCSSGGRPIPIPGSYEHFDDDAKTFASWGMDYVKMDWCHSDGERPEDAYRNMSMALNATGRPIYFLTCEWGVDDPWQWMRHYANAWRATGDHHDDWDNTANIIEELANIAQYAGCFDDKYGCGYNYADFLMTGGQGCDDYQPGHRCPGMTDTEYHTEAAIWTIAMSPIIVATDLRNMSQVQKDILLNKELIDIHQDPLLKAGGRVSTWSCSGSGTLSDSVPECQIWARDLANGDKAVVLYNADSKAHSITLPFHVLGWPGSTVSVRDVYGHKTLGNFSTQFTPPTLDPHAVFFGRVTCVAGDC